MGILLSYSAVGCPFRVGKKKNLVFEITEFQGRSWLFELMMILQCFGRYTVLSVLFVFNFCVSTA